MKRFGAFLGRLACGLGAAAILLLCLDPVLGTAGYQLPGGLLRYAILAPLALGGFVAGFLLLRRLTADPTTRRLLVNGAAAPFVLVLSFVAATTGITRVATYEVLVGLLILCWTLYAASIVWAGLRLRRAEKTRAAGSLLCGVGAGLLLQALGGAGGLLLGPDRAWPGPLIQTGIAVAATFAAALLIALVFGAGQITETRSPKPAVHPLGESG